MPLRDEQDFELRRQQIIDGALEVFAEKGFERATNKDIAEAASIGSPGLIYHYFKDKADLFRQVLEQRAPVLQLLNRSEELMDLPPREALTLFGTTLLNTLQNRPAVSLFRLILARRCANRWSRRCSTRSGRGAVSPSYRATWRSRWSEACCAAPTQARRRAVLSAR